MKNTRELNPKVRTILISAYEVENDPVFQGYVKEGIIDILIQKPIPIEVLCERAKQHINAYLSKQGINN